MEKDIEIKMKEETNELEIVMEVTDEFLSELNKAFELEILQGIQTSMIDGRTKLEFTLTGEKADLFKQFVDLLVSTPSSEIRVKYCGLDINPN